MHRTVHSHHLCFDKSINELYLCAIRNKKQARERISCLKKTVRKRKFIVGRTEKWKVVEKVNEVDYKLRKLDSLGDR
jgi:hypothetical protein